MSPSQDPPKPFSSTEPRDVTRSELPSIEDVSQTFSLAAPRVPRDLAESVAAPPWWRSRAILWAVLLLLALTGYRWMCANDAASSEGAVPERTVHIPTHRKAPRVIDGPKPASH